MGSKQKAARLMHPTCTVKAACDGNVLGTKRIEAGICATCETALAKRGKSIAPRGINFKEKSDR